MPSARYRSSPDLSPRELYVTGVALPVDSGFTCKYAFDKKEGISMRRLVTNILTGIALTATAVSAHAQSPVRDDCASPSKQPLTVGCKLLDEFMDAFNKADPVAFAAPINYPHIRIAGPKVVVWNTAEEYIRDNPRESMVAKDTDTKFKGWKTSRWDWRRLIQYSDQTMHFTVSFGRLDGAGNVIATFESLYILTNKDGRWGIQARSSFAGIANGGAY